MNASIALRAWYENHFIQLFHADASARTVVEYQATLNLWEILTDNKPIGEISSLDIANFRAAIAKLPGRKKATTSPATVNKHLRHLNHLFGKAGPPGPHNRDAMGIIKVAPWAKALRTFQRRPRAASLPAIRAFYRSCTCDWWRAFVVCAFHLGSRCHALDNMLEADVDFGSRRVTFRAEFDKRRTERIKPLSTCVVRHLVPIRGSGLPSKKVDCFLGFERLAMTTHLLDQFDSETLLQAVDELDTIRGILADGPQAEPPNLRLDLMQLHKTAMRYCHGSNGDASELVEQAEEVECQVEEICEAAEGILAILRKITATEIR